MPKSFGIPFASTPLSNSSTEGVHVTNLQAKKNNKTKPKDGLCAKPQNIVALNFDSPVKRALAVLKHVPLAVFAKHFGSHGLKHMAVQQSLADTHDLVPWHRGTFISSQIERRNDQIMINRTNERWILGIYRIWWKHTHTHLPSIWRLSSVLPQHPRPLNPGNSRCEFSGGLDDVSRPQRSSGERRDRSKSKRTGPVCCSLHILSREQEKKQAARLQVSRARLEVRQTILMNTNNCTLWTHAQFLRKV